MQTDPPAGVSASPVPDNVMTWNAVIIGPADTPFEDGTFRLVMHFEEQYPNKPPSVKFISQMFHPNVYATGELCLDILQNRWSPTYDVAAVLTSIQRWVGSRRRGKRKRSPSPRGSSLTACFTVFSTTQTPDRRQMSRHPTCTRTIARNIPNGSVKRSRRAGRSRLVRIGDYIQPDGINHGCWEHRTPSWRRRFELLSRALAAVNFLIIKAGLAYPVFYNFIPAARAFEQAARLWPYVSRRVLRQRMAKGRVCIISRPLGM